jgi:hypothetical protein
MTYFVRIRKNETGEVRNAEMEWDWLRNGPGGDMFWWTDGNFGCDCNRELQFEYAVGKEYDEIVCECSTGRFTVLDANLPDGTVIKIDPPTTQEAE